MTERDVFYAVWKSVATVLFQFIGPVKVYGVENVPADGPCIMACNHQSYLDPVLANWKLDRKIRPMGKKQLFRIPVFGPFIQRMGAFPVDRDGNPRQAIRLALEILKNGEIVFLFPEGTRTRGPLGRAEPGVALLARKSGVPVVPVLITGAHRSLSPDSPFLKRGLMTVTYGQPIVFDPDEKRPDLQADADRIMEAIASLRAVTPGAPPPIREEDLPPPRKSPAKEMPEASAARDTPEDADVSSLR